MRRIAALLFAAGSLALAQQPAPQPDSRPVFEAASIKPAVPSPNGNSTLNTDPGRLTATNWPMRLYIKYAYGMKADPLLVGGPSWINFDPFDITATIVPPEADARANNARIQLALQVLLEDRIHLALHKESRPGNGFALTVAKNGPKLKPAAPGAQNSNHTRNGSFTADAATMKVFANQLTLILGSEVEDRTGIDGVFQIRLTWSPDAGRPNNDAPPGLTIFEALEEQTGLKLSSAKIVQEVFVIDHAEKPAAN